MALSSAAAALRNAVLMHLRVPASSSTAINALPTFTGILTRGFSSGFLDKSAVVERVIYVAKHFEKVDPAKVSRFRSSQGEVATAAGACVGERDSV